MPWLVAHQQALACLLQAIRAKAESLLGILEQVDSVPAPSSPDGHLHTLPASQRYKQALEFSIGSYHQSCCTSVHSLQLYPVLCL